MMSSNDYDLEDGSEQDDEEEEEERTAENITGWEDIDAG